MSIETQIIRLQEARDTIKTKLVELGVVESSAKLDTCATAISQIENKGAVSASVREGETYTIPAGYHNGAGTISGVSGGGNYSLQSKTVTPTKSLQAVTADDGYFGLSDVQVAPIPEAYQDVSSVTATSADVLATKIIVTPDGTPTAGTMINNGGVNETIDGLTTTSYTIPSGYHDGTGTVSLTNDIENALAAI